MAAPPRPNPADMLQHVVVGGEHVGGDAEHAARLGGGQDVLQPFRTLGGHGHRRYRRDVVAVVAARPLLDRWSR